MHYFPVNETSITMSSKQQLAQPQRLIYRHYSVLLRNEIVLTGQTAVPNRMVTNFVLHSASNTRLLCLVYSVTFPFIRIRFRRPFM